MKVVHVASALLFSFVVISQQTVAQSPGGVQSPLYWFHSASDNGNLVWRDSLNPRATFNPWPKTAPFTINFNLAYRVAGQNVLRLHDASLEQASIFGAYFPSYNEQLSLESPAFYSVFFNNQQYHQFGGGSLRSVDAATAATDEVPFSPDFSVPDLTALATSMKAAAALFSRLPRNVSNVWADDEETRIDFTFRGYLPEFIIYNRVLTRVELRRVYSYLAIKYGLTINSDYRNSADEIIWRVTSNPFHHRVTAIGKDSLGAIRQRTSHTTYEELVTPRQYSFTLSSTDTTARSLTIGFTKAAFDNLKDRQFLFWGDNNKRIDSVYEIKPDSFPGLHVVSRQWIMQNSYDVQLPTRAVVGGAVRDQLAIQQPCYFLIDTELPLASEKIYPVTTDIIWRKPSTVFTIGSAELLRKKVMAMKRRKLRECDQIQEIGHGIDLSRITHSGTMGYYKLKWLSTGGFNCGRKQVYKYIKATQELVVYLGGGIGPYKWEITGQTPPGTVVSQGTGIADDRGKLIMNVTLPAGSNYQLKVTDKTNQKIFYEIKIK